jgi:pyrroloquinoline quinone biosynthesis protein B
VLIRVLGSAAGGGFPQWNCGCANCAGVRRGQAGLRSRTQESVAVSADGQSWFLINGSPEIRTQIEGFPGLWPRAPRHSPIAGILLTNGDLDHCLGLLSLRESHPLVVYATSAVEAGFTEGNVLYRTLARFPRQIDWRRLALGEERALVQPPGDRPSGLRVTAIAAPGKLPLHLESSRAPSAEDGVGFLIHDERTGGRLAYFSGVAGPSAAIERAAADAGALFFDGTFWSSDELIAAGLGTRRAEEMAHWPVGGPDGSLGFLARVAARRRILIHVNNTNPILREDGPERRAVEAAGVEVATDGMELSL